MKQGAMHTRACRYFCLGGRGFRERCQVTVVYPLVFLLLIAYLWPARLPLPTDEEERAGLLEEEEPVLCCECSGVKSPEEESSMTPVIAEEAPDVLDTLLAGVDTVAAEEAAWEAGAAEGVADAEDEDFKPW